ncbi:MAG: ferrous iron transport protein B [Eubacteriaceae bacterium]|jgi:ferrous iron transport protein B|nr:ferrous iron transport protein B [Eubacteriaceae bacterium]
MKIRIALTGNPNSGKTTLFNALTGSAQYVGNWPGVTVEKKEGRYRAQKEVTIVDLPGVYSLSPYTLEEVISRDYILEEKPDAIINIVDVTNLERNLYLTTQLLETGIPVVIALNMMDIFNKSGDKISIKALSQRLGCPVLPISALKNDGLDPLMKTALELANQKKKFEAVHKFHPTVETALDKVEKILYHNDNANKDLRWYSIKVFERDDKTLKKLNLPRDIVKDIENIIHNAENLLEDDSESIITGERYELIEDICSAVLQKKQTGLSVSDKIDRVVTNKWLGLPIFIFVMWFMYFISVSTIGTIITDWVNEEFFEVIVTDAATSFLESAGAAPWLLSLLVDGIIGGVGAVLGFVPQIMLLFFFISILEDCGYMARVAFIMDRVFRRFGLSGKSFIPMLIGTGCSVPAIMASRTIEQDRDRKMTIMLTPFIPCSAKIPIFTLMAATFFPRNSLVAPSMYFLGIAMVILAGVLLKRSALFKGDPAPFVMELPPYHLPRPKGVLIHMWEKGKSFIIKAGTVILAGVIIIWFLQSFDWSFQMVETDQSILANIGHAISPLFAPLGFGSWEASVSIFTGFLAKETVVATFGVLFGIAEATEETTGLYPHIAALFTPVAAYAFMAFNLLAAPCFAAIGATKREMGTWKWTFIAIGFQTGLAYLVALVIYQIGSAIFYGTNITGAVIVSALIVGAIVYLLFKAYMENKKAVAQN